MQRLYFRHNLYKTDKFFFRKSNKLLETYLKKMIKAFGQIQNNKIAGTKNVECVQRSINDNLNFEQAQHENNINRTHLKN